MRRVSRTCTRCGVSRAPPCAAGASPLHSQAGGPCWRRTMCTCSRTRTPSPSPSRSLPKEGGSTGVASCIRTTP
ncbi:hypothetical protein SKAU_G00094990 [Synaphobranchus kaupii]|uniref:Uncharacterized protein n=1 Tax=Synaphobranchus kaupii TaxID=118154 RepID=A0A9Q1FYC9_SYNKA|nr:hypothetical protein SKAU_G00094990 [Synaphobranchus kaupii]